MQRHKRKRHIEENSLDIKPNKVGIKVEGSERQKAKREIRSELADAFEHLDKLKKKRK